MNRAQRRALKKAGGDPVRMAEIAASRQNAGLSPNGGLEAFRAAQEAVDVADVEGRDDD